MRRWTIWLPLMLFAGLIALASYGLMRPAQAPIRSQLIGRPLPQFVLPAALPGRPSVASADFVGGQPRLLNVFASWCVPCIAEAPELMALKAAGVRIDAIAIRDRPEDIARFLSQNGDPFGSIGRDDDSRVQLSLGSAGVPETFVIDARGTIRHQHVGAITDADVATILTALEAAR